jgi:hypothetical protein
VTNRISESLKLGLEHDEQVKAKVANADLRRDDHLSTVSGAMHARTVADVGRFERHAHNVHATRDASQALLETLVREKAQRLASPPQRSPGARSPTGRGPQRGGLVATWGSDPYDVGSFESREAGSVSRVPGDGVTSPHVPRPPRETDREALAEIAAERRRRHAERRQHETEVLQRAAEKAMEGSTEEICRFKTLIIHSFVRESWVQTTGLALIVNWPVSYVATKKQCTLLCRGRLASERPAGRGASVRFYRFSRFFYGICATKLFLVGCVITFSLDAAHQSVTEVEAHAINDRLVEVLPH